MTRTRATTASVIIATYNRARLLDECLRHLASQSFAEGDEVIVVDNGSSDDTAAVIERHRASFPVLVAHLDEPRPGKSNALAVALSVASGDVLVFTDDDVNVGTGWLDAVRRTMRDSDVALMGGRVLPRWERRPPTWLEPRGETFGRLTSPLALLNYGPAPIELGDRTVLGANMAVRRDVIAGVGGFAPNLGKLRGTLLSGEDADLCRRVQAAGLRAVYTPDAAVEHWVPASRMRIRYFISWFFWSGITNAALDRTGRLRGRSVFGVPLYLIKRLVASTVAAAVAAAAGRNDRAVERIADTAFVTGYSAYCWGLMQDAAAGQSAGERV